MNNSTDSHGCSTMDTQIFNQGLSVMATSAYIIIAALLGDGMKPAMTAIRERWNSTPEALDRSLAELSGLNIIERHPGPAGGDPIYIVNPASMWAAK